MLEDFYRLSYLCNLKKSDSNHMTSIFILQTSLITNGTNWQPSLPSGLSGRAKPNQLIGHAALAAHRRWTATEGVERDGANHQGQV